MVNGSRPGDWNMVECMNGKLKDHKDLDVWKFSMDFVVSVYEITRAFPKEELYGLTSQIRRAAVSIPSNIAEGATRSGNKEFIQFLYIALASTSEVETQLLIAERLHYIQETEQLMLEIVRIKKMLIGLITYLKGKS